MRDFAPVTADTLEQASCTPRSSAPRSAEPPHDPRETAKRERSLPPKASVSMTGPHAVARDDHQRSRPPPTRRLLCHGLSERVVRPSTDERSSSQAQVSGSTGETPALGGREGPPSLGRRSRNGTASPGSPGRLDWQAERHPVVHAAAIVEDRLRWIVGG